MAGAVRPPVGGADLGAAAVGIDRLHRRARPKFGARVARDPHELAR